MLIRKFCLPAIRAGSRCLIRVIKKGANPSFINPLIFSVGVWNVPCKQISAKRFTPRRELIATYFRLQCIVFQT